MNKFKVLHIYELFDAVPELESIANHSLCSPSTIEQCYELLSDYAGKTNMQFITTVHPHNGNAMTIFKYNN